MLHNMHEGVLILSEIDDGGFKTENSDSNFQESYSVNAGSGSKSSYSNKIQTDTRKLLFSNKPADKLAAYFLG